jgi:hypothetical protein
MGLTAGSTLGLVSLLSLWQHGTACELSVVIQIVFAAADSQILQLTSLLPTAEHFSILLRDALKSQASPVY